MRKPSPARGSGPSTAAGPTPCCTKVGMKRGPWTPEEDEILASFVRREGEGRWRTLPKRAGLLRCGKSCRLRWMNYLRPSIKHGHITADEEDLILRLHRLLGNRWSLIAGRIPGRTDNEIKNYWNTHLSKKLISQGIDPRTHKPLNPIPDHKLKEPAPAPVPYPNPNPKSVSPYPEEADGNSSGVVLHDHQNNYSDGLDGVPDKGWQSSEGFSLMSLQGSHGGYSNEEYGGLDCCTDDIFSSFLDSLINEDTFLQPHQKQQQQQSIDQNEPIDSATGFAIGGHWEAGFTSSATLCEDVQGQFIDRAGKHS